MLYHFDFLSGSNPYIAMTKKEKDRIIRKYKCRNVAVDEIKDGFYLIRDYKTYKYGLPKIQQRKKLLENANLPPWERIGTSDEVPLF